jgi:prolyl-tRNA synthetase
MPTAAVIKTLVFIADDEPVVVLMRGDLDVNEIKVKAALGCSQLHLARDGQVVKLTGAPVGFAGPVGLEGAAIWADESVRGIVGAVVGGNAADAHYVGFSMERDAPAAQFADFRIAGGGDTCGRCGGTFDFFRGIEVGQVFHLGTKYSEPMGATFLDADGKEQPMVMGCYGIGITRILSAAIEQNHDESGMVWPMALAPYQVIVLPMQLQNDEVMSAANAIYSELIAAGVQVIFDDRDVRAGVKFKDADLIGIPLRITIGPRGLKTGEVELRRRGTSDDVMVGVDVVVDELKRRIASETS